MGIDVAVLGIKVFDPPKTLGFGLKYSGAPESPEPNGVLGG